MKGGKEGGREIDKEGVRRGGKERVERKVFKRGGGEQ